MSDRKYRQRGYMDDDRDRERKPQGPRPAQGAPQPRGRYDRPEGPKTPNLMAAHQVVRCARCAAPASLPIGTLSRCTKCGSDLHSCANCVSFNPGVRFECMQPIKARVAPKDTSNDCQHFAPRTTVERETHSAAPSSARQAFDDLFKF